MISQLYSLSGEQGVHSLNRAWAAGDFGDHPRMADQASVLDGTDRGFGAIGSRRTLYAWRPAVGSASRMSQGGQTTKFHLLMDA